MTLLEVQTVHAPRCHVHGCQDRAAHSKQARRFDRLTSFASDPFVLVCDSHGSPSIDLRFTKEGTVVGQTFQF